MRLKPHFQEAYIDREGLEQTAGAAGYGSANNTKQGKMEDDFMNFASTTASQDAALTELKTTNRNLTMKLSHHKDQIMALQAEMCNLKVATTAQITEVRTTSKWGRKENIHEKT